MANQWALYPQLSMSTGTQVLKRSMPNQWAQSLNLSMPTGTQALKRSMSNQWARFQLLCFNTKLLKSS